MYLYEEYSEPDSYGHRYMFEPADNRDLDSVAVNAWCRAEFGPSGVFGPMGIGSRWMGRELFWFRDEIDALHFRMRWC